MSYMKGSKNKPGMHMNPIKIWQSSFLFTS